MAAPPSSVGVSEEQEITWEINVNHENLKTFLQDIEATKHEVQDFLSDDLDAFIEQWIPSGWLDLNLSSFICEFLENVTSGMNITFIPNSWTDLSIPSLISSIVNNTAPQGLLPPGWEDNFNCSDLIITFFENRST